MNDTFHEALRKAAEEAANSQRTGIEHHLRQAFYRGVDFGLDVHRKELANALAKIKIDNTPS